MARNKERLKQQIVVKKYFKERQPRFLTFAEKELIRKLHETKPEEWPVEKLSESFPALPETIRKILHTKWSPKSVESVVRYDNTVVENWKNFRNGKLVINPILKEHLMKFKDRKIILTDRESLAKQFVPSKPEFKKPKSQLFTNIIQTYLDQKQRDTKLLPQGDDPSKMPDISNNSDKDQNLLIASSRIATDSSFAIVNKSEKSTSDEEEHLTRSRSRTDSKQCDVVPRNARKNTTSPFTFDEFVKAKLDDICKESPEEGVALLDVYKKRMDTGQETQTAEIAVAQSDDAVQIAAEENSAVSKNDRRYAKIAIADDNLVDTHIKIWHKKIDTQCDYVNPIKIAKHLYKPGMTYRISDCYYDDDGEFLYRVPGVRS